ncbi:MAG: CbiQ family ECF transporter T component [Solirubrobacterales bacterium]
MRSPLAYSPRPGPLRDASAVSASLYFGSLATIALASTNPLILTGAAAAVVVAGVCGGAKRALAASAHYGLLLAAAFVAVNAIASQRGETILVRGWELPLLGQIDVSAEALAEGAVLAARVVVVLLAFAVLSASVDPDRLLRMLRPVARRSALTATLIARLVPLAARDHTRMREAAALRGPVAAPVGSVAMLRRLVAGALDRSVDVAATLELRGYAAGPPRRAAQPPPGRRSWRFAAAGFAILALGVTVLAGGVAEFAAYPTVTMDAEAQTAAVALALPLLAALPFARVPRFPARAPAGVPRA